MGRSRSLGRGTLVAAAGLVVLSAFAGCGRADRERAVGDDAGAAASAPDTPAPPQPPGISGATDSGNEAGPGARAADGATPPSGARPAEGVYGPAVTTREPQGGEADRLAVTGERLFRGYACTRCHTVGEGYREGPDLGDVALRRDYEWIILMLTEPQYMIQADPDARQLLVEHFHEMPDLELTEDEARALFAYLAREASAR